MREAQQEIRSMAASSTAATSQDKQRTAQAEKHKHAQPDGKYTLPISAPKQ